MKNRLIKFILSFTDYDRIKKENEKLKSDVSTLIEHPGSLESFVIIQSFEMEKRLSKIYWMGSFDIATKPFKGFFSQIEEVEL